MFVFTLPKHLQNHGRRNRGSKDVRASGHERRPYGPRTGAIPEKAISDLRSGYEKSRGHRSPGFVSELARSTFGARVVTSPCRQSCPQFKG